jgi:hypothetical protein
MAMGYGVAINDDAASSILARYIPTEMSFFQFG